jgi:23S rRNA (uracil1939-C5)-methyltransferase
VSQGAFFQPNPRQSEVLFREAAEMCGLEDGTLTLWDLYCGSGTVGIALASNGRAKQLVGIELNQDAVRDAKRNAVENHMSDVASFYAVDLNSKKALSVLQSLQLPSPDVVVVDPPRAGLHPQMVKLLRELAASSAQLKIVYISCNPATMARDVGMLSEGDTSLRPLVLQPVDMLPHTSHLEAICMLSN